MTRTHKWTAGTVVVGLLLLAAGWLLLVGPKRAEASGLRDEATAQTAQNAQLHTQLAELKKLAAELPAAQRALDEIGSKVPDTVGLPALVRRVSALAKSSGVDVVSITPAAPVSVAAADASADSGLQSVSVGLSVTGDYFEVAALLSKLETMGRAFLVTTVSLADASASGEDVPAGTVQAQIQGSVFVRAAAGATATDAQPGAAVTGSTAPAGASGTSTAPAS
ncbi:type 4a pilus biogenesis protein PilO [Motilibacter deserti]|uniref:Type 4a pilus biogenesis protein PilO n=1 Tax=Motilibacter deserti TaxID=2714956 RepID=A0ABX0GXP7_9ACTN|nr:type 4a pilus biogenesis protein PilO [Motilibacter deserti]NHC14013.1 type 4a pilus biogenesis protein PilO [Motilibacter deserti]